MIVFKNFTGARSRRHTCARRIAKPQSELKHVPRLLGVAPLRKLITPGRRELRSAQGFRLVGGKEFRHRAVGPRQPPLRRLEKRPLARGVNGEQTRLPLDHHVTHIGKSLAHECDADGLFWLRLATPLRRAGRKARDCIFAAGKTSYPFRTGPGLARAATSKQ
jgi:hypothetical protein